MSRNSPHLTPSDGTLVNPFPSNTVPELPHMKHDQMIPFYAPDGDSLGFRTLEVAKRLIASGHVKPAYGR